MLLGLLPKFKPDFGAAAAKWRFVRTADLGTDRSEGQLTAHCVEKLQNLKIAIFRQSSVKWEC